MSISNTNYTTFQQFTHLAPFALTLGRKTFKQCDAMYDNDNNSVTFKYQGRKQRGAFIKDQLSVVVKYDDGADLYNITIIHSNGKTFDNTTLFQSDGHFFDSFADIQNFINLQKA